MNNKIFYGQMRKCLFALFFLILGLQPAFAQGVAGWFKKGTDAFEEARRLHKAVKGLIDDSKRSTADYNKNVTVIKGYPNNTGTPPLDAGSSSKLKYKDGVFTNLAWEPVSFFDGQLFPAEIISMSTFNRKDLLVGEMEALSRPLGFRLKSSNARLLVNWEIEPVDKSYFNKMSGTAVCSQSDREFNLMPDIPWNYGVLSNHESAKPINVYFRISDDAGHHEEKVVSLFMRSINDCIYAYKDNDLGFLFTAFIQVSHPEVDKILKEALNTKFITSVKGYQGGPEYVDLQMAAIWKVLQDRGFKYSSITGTDGAGPNIACQAVRTFDKAVKTSQANCVDGTVVFATVLKRIGLHTVLVTTHDHCFLGFYPDEQSFRDEDKSKIRYLETTMLGIMPKLDKKATAAQHAAANLKVYIAARNQGSANFARYKAANDVVFVDVDRSSYVRPIPF